MQRPECQKYKLWKKAQNEKNAGAKKKVKKKRKKKGPLDDCLEAENDEENEKKVVPLHIDYEKCKEQLKKRRRRERAALAKAIPILKIMEDKIQPPLPVREQCLHQRHISCMLDIDRTPSINLLPKGPKTPYTIYGGGVQRKRARQRDTSTKGEKAKDEDATTSQQQNTTETEAGATTGAESEGEGKKKKKKRKKKPWVEVPYQRTIPGSDCDSICSFDSDICLAGLAITADDKKELEKFQKRERK